MPSQIYHMIERRKARRNLLADPWKSDLQQSEWVAINSATVGGVDAITLAAVAGTEVGLSLAADPYVVGREPGKIFLFTGYVELTSMVTGVAPFPFVVGYEDAVSGVVSNQYDLALSTPTRFSVRLTVGETDFTGNPGVLFFRSGDAAKAANLTVRNLQFTAVWPS